MGRRATGTVEPLRTTIRLKFTWQGTRRVETMNLLPTPANLKAAHTLLKRVQAAIAAGVYEPADFFDRHAPVAESFAEVADRWLANKTGAKSTLVCYRRSVAFWKAALPDKAITSIRKSDIDAGIKLKVDAGVTGKTVNNHLIVVRGILQLAEDDGVLKEAPAKKVKSLKHQAPPPDPFERDEMEAILAYMAEHYPEPVLNYFEFAFCTGLRPSEEIIARWGRVDWNHPSLRIDAANVLWEEKDTKTHTVRDVDLSDRALAVLRRQKVFTFMKGQDAPIFCNPLSGKPWADEQRQRRAYFKPTLRALGIRDRDAYNTRHTYATTALMGSVDPSYIARQLGHANAAMLFKRYAKWIDRADKGVQARKLNAILSSNCPRNADAV